MKEFSIIVAMDPQQGIGKDGVMPWDLPGDLKHFKEITCRTSSDAESNAVIMGRRTWDSIPEKFKPLPGRINVVLTRNEELVFPDGVVKVKNVADAFQFLEGGDLKGKLGSIFVIGGAQIFSSVIGSPACQRLFITHVMQEFDCDTFFPSLPAEFQQVHKGGALSDGGISYYFADYERA